MSVDEKEEVDSARRCFLQRATATVGTLGLAAASIPFINYWMPSVDTEAAAGPVTVDISSMKPGEQLTVAWQARPVWIINRTEAMLKTLPELNELLRDPFSQEDQQPAYAKNLYRSIKPEFLVAIGICTHLGCIPTYRPDVGTVTPNWLGGFYCPCHGSIYDLAGRVFKNVPAPLNLVIPNHFYKDDHTLVIGVDKLG